jgi:threonine dehydrogenase-like Zn-dependent dehydrogenase
MSINASPWSEAKISGAKSKRKEWMRRSISVVASGHVDLRPLVTHRFKLDKIEAAYDPFAHQRVVS